MSFTNWPEVKEQRTNRDNEKNERVSTWLQEYRQRLKDGEYRAAYRIVLAHLRGGLLERAPVCSAGHDRVRELCMAGRLKEAKKLVEVFEDFSFKVYLEKYST